MRTPQQIASDLRAMANMLIDGANELEQVTAIDAGMLTALKTLAPLFGGGTAAQSRPPLNVARTNDGKQPASPLPAETRRDILIQFKNFTEQGMEKQPAFARIHTLYPQASKLQIAAICNRNHVLARQARAVLHNSNSMPS